MHNTIENLLGFSPDSVEKLCGYSNANYLVRNDATKFIFKTYKPTEGLKDVLEAESDVLIALSEKYPCNIPQPQRLRDGSYLSLSEINGQAHLCRCLSFIEGDFWGDIFTSENTDAQGARSKDQALSSLGRFIAQLSLDLERINNYAIKARRSSWDSNRLLENHASIKNIENHELRRTVAYFFQKFREHISPHLLDLPHSLIHGDVNEWNLLIQKSGDFGLIDFGDLCYSATVNELAITIVYVAYTETAPLESALPLIAAYHQTRKLNENEITALYYLVAARLCNSLCHSADARKLQPDNNYASSSEDKASAMLQHWLELNPVIVEQKVRQACGLPALAKPSANEILKRRQKHISSILSLSYREPIYFTLSALQYMYDGDGNTFLDAYNNIPHVGHCHPRVVAAGQQQMAKLNTNTRYLYDALPSYAEKLLTKFPPELNKVFFVNSGSAASDLAIRMAKTFTSAEKLMVMEHGYHGNTQSSMEISDYKFNHPKGSGQRNFIVKAELPDTYRGNHRQDDGTAGKHYARQAIAQITESAEKIAAFICEPIVGCGGQIPLAKGYLAEVYPAIRAQGGVCVSDEVQTGFGRLGDVFWGYEAQNVVPDIVILGKPMANGHPMGAVVCTDKIAEAFASGVEFFSSFGGNPVSCSIAEEVLAVIEDEDLQNNAKITGDHYRSLLTGLQDKYSCIGDVRGSGLFLGVDIVKGEHRQADTELAQELKNHLREHFILISTDGPYDNVLKTKPPLVFTKKNAERVVSCIDAYLRLRF